MKTKQAMSDAALEATQCAVEILVEASKRLRVPMRDFLYWHDLEESEEVPIEDRMNIGRAVGTVIGVALALGLTPQDVMRMARRRSPTARRQGRRDVAGDAAGAV